MRTYPLAHSPYCSANLIGSGGIGSANLSRFIGSGGIGIEPRRASAKFFLYLDARF